MEVYIDEVVIKSHSEKEHLLRLEKSLYRMRSHKLKMNSLKCAFGVSTGKFLGFLIHKKGIDVDKNKAKAIIEDKPPKNKKELQRFLGQINFLRRFISNLARKSQVFSPLLRLKSDLKFQWVSEHQNAFESIKQCLTSPHVSIPPVNGKPLKLYISVNYESIGSLLAQDNEQGFE